MPTQVPHAHAGEPVNFNFLPQFATPALGVAPHTVQTYSFDDPAPTYGNTNFSFMLDWATRMASPSRKRKGSSVSRRDVLFYGETAYWVNFDMYAFD